jgi:hypothetical protein
MEPPRETSVAFLFALLLVWKQYVPEQNGFALSKTIRRVFKEMLFYKRISLCQAGSIFADDWTFARSSRIAHAATGEQVDLRPAAGNPGSAAPPS